MPELDLSDFEVMSRQVSRPMQFTFGVGGQQQIVESTTRLALLVRARREGRFEVGPASAVVGGTRISSGTITISVGAGAGGTNGQPAPLTNPGAGQPSTPPGSNGPPAGPLDGAIYDDQAFLRTVVDRHEAELRQSVELARRFDFVAARSMRLVGSGAVLVVLLVAVGASRVAGHLSRQLSRPLDELVGWTGLIRAGRPIPEQPERLGAPEFEVLRTGMRTMAQELDTGRRRALDAERAEAFRESARRFAHELKNPLTPIRFAVDRLRRSAPEELRDTVEVLAEEAARGPDLLEGFQPRVTEVLEGLRARRTEIEAREQALAAREMLLAATERRLAQRIEELAALQQRLAAFDRTLTEREETGWRQMVKLYEGMRPRDAAVIFDELDLPVLVQILDRMGQRKAAPVLGAMKPERARIVTAELARQRARPAE
jgi:flagellar motility protein MotE (MotC chaperone)